MKSSRLFFLLALIVSCGHVPQTRYYLIDVAGPDASAAKKKTALWLREVSTDAVHTQDRLVYRTSAFEVQFDPYRRWALTPIEMVKQETLDYLRQSAQFTRVSDDLSGMQPPFLGLRLRIREFEEYATVEKRTARVVLHAQVSEGMEERLLWEGDVTAESAIQGSDAGAIIQAMSSATERALRQLLERLAVL